MGYRRARAAVQRHFGREIRFAVVHDAPAVDVRRHVLTIVRALGGDQDQAHAEALGDLDGLQDALAFGEAAEEEEVVLGLLAEGEGVHVDAVQHGANDVQALQQVRLLVGDRHERGFRIAGPQRDFGRTRRVVERLHDRGPRQAREGQRHRVVRRLVVNEVELGRTLDGGGQIQHLVQLPRPHLAVVPVTVGVDRG